MRRGSVIGVIALGAAVIAIPLLWNTDNQQDNVNNTVRSTANERGPKLHVMNQDVQMTENMFIYEALSDMKAAFGDWKGHNDTLLAQKIKTFVEEQPHFEYMCWINKSKQHNITSGKIPHNGNNKVEKQLSDYVNTAKTHIDKQSPYQSKAITLNGKRHVVLALPDERIHGGVVVVINEHILHNVRNHQQRNLRIIPYPPEGKYRVESVDSNTHQDVTVRDGEDNEGTSHYYKYEVVVRFRNQPSNAELERMKKDIHCTSMRKVGYTYVFKSKSLDSGRLENYFSQFNPLYIEPHYLYMTNDEKRADGTPTSLNANTLPSRNTQQTTGPSDMPYRPRAAAATEEPNDALYKPYQWDFPLTKTNAGWSITKGSSDVIIAVVDTGIDLNHKDLKDKLTKGYNAINPGQQPTDDVGHGTHVAGVIGATTNNKEGIAGMTWYNPIMPVKVLDNTGAGTSYSVAEGIIWATDNGAKVINLSLGNYAQGAFLHDAVKYANDHDVVIVAATGNDNTAQPGYPAAYPEVFAVSATNQDLSKAPYSNYGDYVDVVAPGTTIASSYPNNQYAALSGTSMASPHVAALAGLIRSVNPALRNTDVYAIMRESVEDLGSPGKDAYFGYGQINVEQALKLAQQRGQGQGSTQPMATTPEQPRPIKNRFERWFNRYFKP